METCVREEPNVDSAIVVVMMLELESEFDSEVEDEEIMNLKTVGDVVKHIDAHQ